MPAWGWAVVAFTIWAFGVGATIGLVLEHHARKCDRCTEDYACDQQPGADLLFLAALWTLAPIAAPFIAGGLVGDWVAKLPDWKKARAERKVANQKRLLAEQNLAHERKKEILRLEREACEAALKVLDAEGWKARVEIPEEVSGN